MGVKTDLEILALGVEYAKKCNELEDSLGIDLWLWDTELRFGKYTIPLNELADCKDANEALECCYDVEEGNDLENLLGNKYYDGAILCEGYVYESLYYYEGYGDASTYGREATKVLFDELDKILEKHGFHMDLSRGGTIQLQCHESYEIEAKETGLGDFL